MRIFALPVATLLSRRGLVAASLFLGCLAPAFGAGGAASTTTLAVTSSGSAVTTVAAGSVVTLTATVTSGGAPVSPGQVKFCDAAATYCEDSHLLGIAQLTSSGTATFSFRPAIGSQSYKAVFLGTTSAAGSSSAVTSLAVMGKWPTTTTYSQGGTSSSATLIAAVVGTGTFAESPTGTVSFVNLASGTPPATLATAPLGAGTATLNFPAITGAIDTSSNGSYVVVADFNGDGILDVASAENAPISGGTAPALDIYLGKGDGSFSFYNSAFAPPSLPVGVIAADFNGDGKLDLAYWTNEPSSLTVLLGNGDGSFTNLAVNPPACELPSSVVAGDFNRDGKEDMAVTCRGSDAVSILLGNGDGTFASAAASAPVGGTPEKMAVADFNGDGNLDLAVLDTSSSTVTILLGNGDGTFTPTATSPVSDGQPIVIVTGDFNGDGIPDLALPGSQSNSMVVLLGNGDGTFNSRTSTIPAGQFGAIGASIADFNGDGLTDIALANNFGDDLIVLLGKGDGTFAEAPNTPNGGGSIQNIAVSDLNGDGSPDMVFSIGALQGTAFAGYLTERTETAYAAVGGVSLSGIAAGSVNASYPGDANFAASGGGQALTPTLLTLSISPAGGGVVNQPVTLTATLNPYAEAGFTTNGETVDFSIGPSTKAATLLNGVATVTFTPTMAESYELSANYVGDSNYAASATNIITYGVSPMASETSLDVSDGPVAAGTVVTLHASVETVDSAVNQGQVKFCDASATYCEDSHLLGIAQLIDGSATLKYVPGVGKHVYEAIFLGTKTVAGSTSNQPIVTVTGAGTPYPSATTVALGSSTMSLQSTVSASGIPAGTPAPTGTVSFLDESNGGAVLATGTLVPGSASVGSGTTPVPGAGPFGGATISGDFNGDGCLDLAVSTPGGLSILLNNGAGTFTPVTTGTPLPGAVQMVAGDFNGDGHLDIASLATNTVNPSIAVTLLLGNGDGTFTEAPSPYAATGLGYIVAGDFNGDGIEDLAVSSNIADGAGTTTVLLGNGDGSFTLGSQSDVYGQLAAGDFNGDGIADLAVYYRNPEGGQLDGGTVYVALGGSSSLTFSPAFNLDTLGISGQTTSQFIVAADFNGDGMSDLFLGVGGIGTLQDPNAPNCGLALYLATGNGAFNDGTLYPSNAASVACTTGGYNSGVAGDFNGDGYLDVAVTQGDGSAPVQLYAVGAPGFSGTGVSVGTSNAASVPTAGMFDKSGIAGIAVLTAYNPPTDLFLLLPSTSTTVSSVTVNSFSLPEGTTHQVEASYGGDSNYSPSTSPNTVAITGHGIATSLTLTASPAGGATLGEAVTLTAVLSPYSTQSATTNGELVTFQAGNEVVGTGTLNNGTATVTFTPAYPSSSYLSASYGGDKNFASSTASSSSEYRVNPAPTTLSLTASPANLQIGGTLTLTATLNPYTAAGLSTDGEAVTFSSGGMVLGTGKLASGVATLQITLTSIGSASYSAMYAGDANFLASSGNVSYTVNPVPTTLALAVSPLGTTAGQSATLTATLAPYSVTAAGVSSNGEKVTFYTGTTSLGTGTLTNGVATLATTALPAGVDSLTAQYAGDGTLAPSTSAPVSDTVLAIPSITFAVANKTYGVAPFTVAATSTSTGAITYSVVSGPATISGATVTVTGAGTVVLQASQAATSADIAGTQNASFVVAPAQLAIAANSVARVFGVANPAFTGTVTGAVNGDTFTETFSTTATIASSVGSYPITPSVTGTNLADYAVSVTPGTLTVTQAGTSTTLALTNGNKTFTATVTSLTSGNPTGTVTFYEGQTAVGTGTVSGGVATYTASSFPVGDVVVSAEYSGDANFTESQSPPILLLGLALGADSLTVGQSGSVTDTVTVSVVPGYTGTVTFSCAGLPANASCSFAPASVAFSGTSASAQVTATISTGVSGQARVEGLGDSAEVWAAGLLAPGLLGLAMAGRRKRLRAGLIVLVLCGLGLGLTACGGGKPLTPEGQTTVQVVATGPEGLSQTSSVTLMVQ